MGDRPRQQCRVAEADRGQPLHQGPYRRIGRAQVGRDRCQRGRADAAAGAEGRDRRGDQTMTAHLSRLALVALLGSLAACKEEQQASIEPAVRPVLSVVAVVRPVATLGPFAGPIEPRYKTDLGFRIFGRMVARFVDVGAIVHKGQELAALDPAVQALGVRSAEAALSSAEAQYANAEAEEGRQRDLVLR